MVGEASRRLSAVRARPPTSAEWWVERREPRFDELSWLGSMLSDTLVKIVVTALVCGTMLLVWRVGESRSSWPAR